MTGRVRERCAHFGASTGANSGRCNAACAGEPDEPSELGEHTLNSAARSNPGNAASVQAQTVVTSPALTTPAQPSNAGGMGLQPGYMNDIIPPEGFNPQLFANPTMWGAFPPPWAVAFQAMQCQAPMPQTICTPAASTQINPDIRPPSHSSTDYPDVVDPFLSREEQDEF